MPTLSGWSLRRRLTVALVVLASVLFSLMMVAVVLVGSVRSQQRAVIDRYFIAVSISNQRFIQQLDAETAVRGYALSASVVSLQPLHAYHGVQYSRALPRLEMLLRGDTATLGALAAWDQAANAWYQGWAIPTIAEVQHQGGDALTASQVITGKNLFDDVRDKYTVFVRGLVARRNQASHALSRRTTQLLLAVILFAATLATAGALSWLGLRRWVLVPLAAVGEETQVVRGGALDHEVRVSGPREVVDLAADVDGMRQDIVDKLAAVEQARQEIEAARITVEAQAQDLARSNRDLEQFAYVASHDLQEPLRKVASFCQLLEQRYAGQLDERADTYIAYAVDGAKRMQQLINDLLVFSRVGRTDRKFQEVEVRDCVVAALENLSVVAEAAEAKIVIGELPRIRGDAGLLTQLYQNLVGNAIKFRGDKPPLIRLTAEKVAGGWEFGCSDEGLGIDPQFAERIFVIFQRLHGRDEYDGTGIGLALCKRIVEHHGGKIWLEPSSDAGANFRWTLPGRTESTKDAIADPPERARIEAPTSVGST